MDVADDTKSDTLALILIVLLLTVVVLILPLLGWMITDSRETNISARKTNKETKDALAEIQRIKRQIEKEQNDAK